MDILYDLEPLALVAENASNQLDSFIRDFVLARFQVPYEDHKEEWKNATYEGLSLQEELGKDLDIPLPVDYLESVDMDEVLKKSHTALQKIVVSLEKVSTDEEEKAAQFSNELSQALGYAKQVAVEVEELLERREVKAPDDITEDFMNQFTRNMEHETFRMLRDWFVLREYMVALQYVLEVFTYILKQS